MVNCLILLASPHCRCLCRRRVGGFASIVIVDAISVVVAVNAFSRLLIVVCAPTIAVASGVFIATAAVHGGRTATAAAMPATVALLKLPPRVPHYQTVLGFCSLICVPSKLNTSTIHCRSHSALPPLSAAMPPATKLRAKTNLC